MVPAGVQGWGGRSNPKQHHPVGVICQTWRSILTFPWPAVFLLKGHLSHTGPVPQDSSLCLIHLLLSLVCAKMCHLRDGASPQSKGHPSPSLKCHLSVHWPPMGSVCAGCEADLPGPAWQGGGSPEGSSCPIALLSLLQCPLPAARAALVAVAASAAAQCNSEHPHGQERRVWPEIPVPWLSPGCSVCLAAGRRHSLPWLCPLTCWRGCHMCYLMDIRCTAALTQGKPGLCRILLLLSDAAFTTEPFSFSSGQGDEVSPAPHQRGQCLLGLLWVPLQSTGDQQRGTAGRGNPHSRYPPCFLPQGKRFDELAQSPLPDAGSSRTFNTSRVLAQDTDMAAARGEERKQDPAVPPWEGVQARGVLQGETQITRVIPKDHSEGCVLTWDLQKSLSDRLPPLQPGHAWRGRPRTDTW